MVQIEEYVNIRDHSTFKVGGQFRYFTSISTIDELKEAYAFAKEKNLHVLILGGGSNMVFPDGVLDMLAIKMNISGFDVIAETEEYADIRIGAGENWDSVVERSVQMNLSGTEALSAIPGTAGATPVQNVGAYGQEIKDAFLEAEVFDSTIGELKVFSNADCQFAYRDSVFKHEPRGKYVILSLTLRFLKKVPTVPNYPGVKKYFEEKGITFPSLREIREAIIEIRSVKLPDPKKIANVGSFFKNPIVEKSIAEKLAQEYPKLTTFPVSEIKTKVPAGWLIEAAGLKGKNFGAISIYAQNALVLVNNGSATYREVITVRDEIINLIYQKFNIILEQEPETVKINY